jgi:hypothetical protein
MFDRVAVQRVLAHMNACHPAENLKVVRGLAAADAQAAWIAGFDGDGADYLAESPDGPLAIRLTFGCPATTILEAGTELRRLYRSASRPPPQGPPPQSPPPG